MSNFEIGLKGEFFGDLDNCQSIVLLVHGLNLSPERMDCLALELVKRGAYVYRIELSDWQLDVEQAMVNLNQLSLQRKVGFSVVAYSLGAHLTLDFLSKKNISNLKGLILFAPPLKLRWYSHTLKSIKLFS